jgi:hypothetical protein
MKPVKIVVILILLIIITTLSLRYISVGEHIENFGIDTYTSIERVTTMPKYVVSFDRLDNSLNNFFLYSKAAQVDVDNELNNIDGKYKNELEMHKEIWNKMVELNGEFPPFAIVFKSSVVLPTNFTQRMAEFLNNAPFKYDMILFGPDKSNSDAYIITREFAKKILNCGENYSSVKNMLDTHTALSSIIIKSSVELVR